MAARASTGGVRLWIPVVGGLVTAIGLLLFSFIGLSSPVKLESRVTVLEERSKGAKEARGRLEKVDEKLEEGLKDINKKLDRMINHCLEAGE